MALVNASCHHVAIEWAQMVGTPQNKVQLGNPFNEQTPGEYFVGRERELETLRRVLEGFAAGQTNHAFVAGLHGTGKTAFLAKVQAMAVDAGMIGVALRLDDTAPAVDNLRQIIRTAVDHVQRFAASSGTSGKLVEDWDRGDHSALFQQTKTPYPSSDSTLQDFRRIAGIARDAGAAGMVICVDEGQRIGGSALSALKNALQQETRVLLVLSLRLDAAPGGPLKAGRVRLDEIANEAEGDIGASRLFITEIGMGPFATAEEAQRCITRRLEDNIVAFEASVVRAIVQLGDRVPREIIRYANKVWDRAAGARRATDADLDSVVEELHAADVERAHLLAAGVSALKRQVLLALLECGGTATPQDVAQRIQRSGGGEPDLVARAVLGVLEDLESVFPGMQRRQETFVISRPVDVFALRLALSEK